jgi:branched-chain amino acid transport system substrate-binding protein
MKHFILILAASVIVSACGSPEPVRLGFLASLSGRIADLAEDTRNGVLLSIEQQNLAGGINGRIIEVVIRDDRSTPEGAAEGVAELAASGVAAIIGPITSSMAVAALPAANKAKVVMVSPTVTSMQLVGQDDYLFRMNATTRDYARMYADFHYHRTGLRRVAIAMDIRNRAFSQSWLDEFQPAFTALGGEITTVVSFESAPEVAFSDIVEQLVESRPDGLLFIAGTIDVVRLAQQAKRLSLEIPLVAVEWAASEKLHELGGADMEGLHVVESYDRNDSSPRYTAFATAYRNRFRLEPGYTAVAAYEAATVILDSLARRSPDQSLKEALISLGPFDGLQQPIRFDGYGDTTRKGYFVTMRDGRFVAEK